MKRDPERAAPEAAGHHRVARIAQSVTIGVLPDYGSSRSGNRLQHSPKVSAPPEIGTNIPSIRHVPDVAPSHAKGASRFQPPDVEVSAFEAIIKGRGRCLGS